MTQAKKRTMTGPRRDVADALHDRKVSERRPHPSVSDVALALATRRSDPVSKVSLTWNAKGDVQVEVDVTDTDPKIAADKASALFDVLRAKYPRENGG